MNFACNEHLRIAYDVSDDVLRGVRRQPGQLISVKAVLDYVRRRYCPSIELYTRSFTDLSSATGSVADSGAMMSIEFDGQPKSAVIVLNSDMSTSYQRFSLFQQIGHLVTLPPDVPVDQNSYHVSTRIDYDLTEITPEELDSDYYLMREQVANVFALRVLMPSDLFYRKLRELDSVHATARFFDLESIAVISRMIIGG